MYVGSWNPCAEGAIDLYERFEGMTDEQIVKLAQASDGMALEYLDVAFPEHAREK